MTELDLQPILDAIGSAPRAQGIGRVRSVVGLSIVADLPLAKLGAWVEIRRTTGGPLLAQVVGFAEHAATLLPYADPAGLGVHDEIHTLARPMSMVLGDELLGRVLDGLGAACDGGQALEGPLSAIHGTGPDPMLRPPVARVLPLGIRAIDGLCTVGQGQRVGLFAGAGLGKSTLLQQVTQQAAADVIVLCLLGERGRELGEFLAGLSPTTRARTVIVCATSDAPAMARMNAADVATRVAEHFADSGQQVLLLMDSLTRYARAARDVALAAGEMPVRRGYPASVFARLPRLLERAGTRGTQHESPNDGGAVTPGAITALYAVLVEADDMEDPIADELRGLLDGHILLSRDLANRGHFPAIDPLASLSRLMGKVVSSAHQTAATALRRDLAIYNDHKDLIELGAHQPGQNPALDHVLGKLKRIRSFLQQSSGEAVSFEEAVAQLSGLLQ